jgi:hypothetical protein
MDYWDDILARGEQAIRDLCAAQAPEGQRLEFKRKASPDRLGLSDDDKRNLGESLSAMSNAEGGLILFGIEDEKVDGVDHAKSPALISSVESFARSIRALISGYLSPPNLAMEVIAIPFAQQSGAGVAAVRVGLSDSRPHMSLAKGHHTYFLRVDAANIPMVDFQIRDMLRVTTAPRLMVGYQLISGGVEKRGEDVTILESQFVLTLKNEGRVSAKQPYILVRPGTNLHLVGGGSTHFERLPNANNGCFLVQGTSHLVIHPGLDVPAAAFLAHIKHVNGDVQYRLNASTRDYVWYAKCPIVQIKVAVGAENTPSREIEFSINQSELELMAEHLIFKRKPFYAEQWF